MAEDITDLTEDEESEPKTKSKKPPKEKKEKKEKAGKKSKGGEVSLVRKRRGKTIIILCILLFVILVIATAVVFLYYNLFEARYIVGEYVHEPLIAVAVWFNPELMELDEELRVAYEARTRVLDTREAGQDRREEELLDREYYANARELALDRRSIALDRREEQINAMLDTTIPIFRRTMTEQERLDLESLSRTYAQMAPVAAAGILAELPEPEDAAVILFFMAERNAGAILAAMDPDFAAAITEILLS
ncbi:MAG: hypothetical protein FWB97_02135 [Oscillospiraceae bacterium]|nr:hypothetical protein [Oscillospiraceae bacterium]